MSLSSVFDYAAQPKEPIICPLCGTDNPREPKVDRYGFAIGLSTCACGLSYLNPRMTLEAYADFYATGAYRRLVQARFPYVTEAFRAAHHDYYAGGLALWLKDRGPVTHLLDAGGGTGLVGERVGRRLQAQTVTVLDPSRGELAQAAARGLRTIEAPLERIPNCGPFDAIVCAQTLDHLCDPLAALRGLRRVGTGWLWVDIVTSHWKIDHPLYWTAPSLGRALRLTGWQVTKQARVSTMKLGVLAV